MKSNNDILFDYKNFQVLCERSNAHFSFDIGELYMTATNPAGEQENFYCEDLPDAYLKLFEFYNEANNKRRIADGLEPAQLQMNFSEKSVLDTR